MVFMPGGPLPEAADPVDQPGVDQPGGVERFGVDVLGALEGCVDDVVRELKQRHGSYADARSLEAVHRLVSKVEWIATKVTGAFDVACAYEDDEAKTAAVWMAVRCRVPKSDAKRRVKLSRCLRDLPHTDEAFSSGQVTRFCAQDLASLSRPGTEAALRRDEEMLVGEAKSLRYDETRRLFSYWLQIADEEAAERDFDSKVERRGAYLAKSFDDTWMGRICLDPIGGTILASELERLSEKLFEKDWRKAKEELGRDPSTSELPRSQSQRRADAFVEMAKRSASSGSSSKTPGYLLSVLVDYDTLRDSVRDKAKKTYPKRVCELADGTVVPPAALVQYLSEAHLERAVFGPGTRVEIGPATRLFGGATRRAVVIRDRECTNPYCDEPASRCEADHIVPYSEGGPTVLENGRLLCPFHNRLAYLKRHPPPTGPGP
jgi:Domain of unknown function (DUF222)/HNH endonuclease